MNAVKKPSRRHLKNGQIINFNHSQKTRRGSTLITYKCRVVLFEGVEYLRTEAGRTWFVPVQEGDGYTYQKVTSTRNKKTVKELETAYATQRHREWRRRTGYTYQPQK